jgi:hypothetical protein
MLILGTRCDPSRPGCGPVETLPPAFGQTIVLSGGGTSRGCSPRSASNYHYGKGYPWRQMRVNEFEFEGNTKVTTTPSAITCTLHCTARRTPAIIHATMRLTYGFLLVMLTAFACAQVSAHSTEVESVYPAAHSLYVDLHENPELSSHETQTAAKLAGRFRDLGYSVTENVGGTGVVAVLKNGAGPTVMFRAELDGASRRGKDGSSLRQQSPRQR